MGCFMDKMALSDRRRAEKRVWAPLRTHFEVVGDRLCAVEQRRSFDWLSRWFPLKVNDFLRESPLASSQNLWCQTADFDRL
jgi:hypothetical protein